MKDRPPSFVPVPPIPLILDTEPLPVLRTQRDRLADAIVEEWPEEAFRVERICVQHPTASECVTRMLSGMGELVIFYSEGVMLLQRICTHIAVRERALVASLRHSSGSESTNA